MADPAAPGAPGAPSPILPGDPGLSGAADASGDPGMEEDDGGGGQTLFSVMANSDGTYQLVQGSGDDQSDVPSEDGGGVANQGQMFDSPGALLKGILDILKDHEAQASGEGSQDDNFQQGFDGGSGASPAKPQPPSLMASGG